MGRTDACFATLLVMAAALAACNSKSPAPERQAAQLTAAETRGHQLYHQYCDACHRNGERGPKLDGVFRRKYLPSGTPANDDRMRDVIRLGHGTMPGFGNVLTTPQINHLIAYMHTL